MKEIKFRVYDKEKKRMSYAPISLNFSADGHINGVALFTDGFTTNVVGKDGMEWMQYTGLKDKNGKEIYEGDIYTVNFNWNNKEIIKKSGKIIYNHDGFKIQFPDKSNPRRLGTNSNKLNGEVIGNKYENPELLTHKPI